MEIGNARVSVMISKPIGGFKEGYEMTNLKETQTIGVVEVIRMDILRVRLLYKERNKFHRIVFLRFRFQLKKES